MKTTHLSHLALFKISGEDAAAFLQGQLTQNIFNLNENKALYTLYCNKEGRVLANFILFKKEDSFYFILAKDLKEKIIAELKKYVLRSRVFIELENPKLWGVFEENEENNADCLNIKNNKIYFTKNTSILIEGEYENDENLFSYWQILEIKNTLPWIMHSTSGLFTPQMLGMEYAVDFHKGCYLGQEVIARTHYLGKTKRKVLRFKAKKKLNIGENIFNEQKEKAGVVLYGAFYENEYYVLCVLNEDFTAPFYNNEKLLLEEC